VEPVVPVAQPASAVAQAAASATPAAILWVAAIFRPPSSFSQATLLRALSGDVQGHADSAVKVAWTPGRNLYDKPMKFPIHPCE
jgi:hypothetical protein